MSAERSRAAREYGLVAAELGDSASQTLMVALLPVLLVPLAPSAVWIGAVIALEGVAAMLVPYIIGGLSDSLPPAIVRRFGRRNTFILLSAPIMAATVVAAPFLGDFRLLAATAFLYFLALHAMNAPHLALLIDLSPEDRWGHVQGYLGSLHALGLGYGLVASGLLFSVVAAPALPDRGGPHPRDHGRDVLGGAGGQRGADAVWRRHRQRQRHRRRSRRRGKWWVWWEGVRGEGRFWGELLGRAEVRWFLVANSLWTAAINGIRPYIFIFALVVLGITVAQASLVLLFLFAGFGVGSVLVGFLGDRLGRRRVLMVSALLTAVALAFGVFVDSVGKAILLLVPAGLGAAALGVLPYPVFAELADGSKLGRSTGVFRFSVGFARLLAPLFVGAAIDHGAALFPEQAGYPMMWPAAAVFALCSVGALWKIR